MGAMILSIRVFMVLYLNCSASENGCFGDPILNPRVSRAALNPMGKGRENIEAAYEMMKHEESFDGLQATSYGIKCVLRGGQLESTKRRLNLMNEDSSDDEKMELAIKRALQDRKSAQSRRPHEETEQQPKQESDL